MKYRSHSARQWLYDALSSPLTVGILVWLIWLLVLASTYARGEGPAIAYPVGQGAEVGEKMTSPMVPDRGPTVNGDMGPAQLTSQVFAPIPPSPSSTTTVPPTTTTVPISTTTVPTTTTIGPTSTTSTTASTTSTTTVAWPVSDVFNRAGPALGASWTTPLTFYSIAPVITSNAATGQVGTVGLAVWNAAQPQNDSYAEGQVIWASGDTGSMVGACLVVPAAQDAACCILNQGWLSFQVADSGASLTEQNRTASAFSSGDWVAITRSGAQTFQCYSSKDGIAWTNRGTPQTVTTMATGGVPGFTVTSNGKSLDQWKGGLGATP